LAIYLADTNVVIRRLVFGDPMFLLISSALSILDHAGDLVYITPQNLVEFQALATRPASANGWGMTTAQASTEARKIEAVFTMLPEIPAIYPRWRNLIDSYNVIGRQVYDARLVAVMQAHGVTNILTLDPTGFRRYREITVVTPQDLVNPSP
jgi:predicted nucleic acid-binding protein